MAARKNLPSLRTPGLCMSRIELAILVNDYLNRHEPTARPLDRHVIARYENGYYRWPRDFVRSAFREALNVDSDAKIGFYPRWRRGPGEQFVTPAITALPHTAITAAAVPTLDTKSTSAVVRTITSPFDMTPMIVTASLTNGLACVARGKQESIELIDRILGMTHGDWETTMSVADVEFKGGIDGYYPDHQLRISVDPDSGYAAMNYMGNDDPTMPIANSYNPERPTPEIDLVFNGRSGSVFPRISLISIPQARKALIEWLETRKRPTCVVWRPYDGY